MKNSSTISGELRQRGVEAAERYLARKGYEVVERGFEGPAGTVDLIVTDGETLAFVEVAVRGEDAEAFPAERVGEGRRTAFEMNAIQFLRGYDEVGLTVRGDVVSIVVVAEGRALLKHHVAAYSAA